VSHRARLYGHNPQKLGDIQGRGRSVAVPCFRSLDHEATATALERENERFRSVSFATRHHHSRFFAVLARGQRTTEGRNEVYSH
jgi:hypothetical protein